MENQNIWKQINNALVVVNFTTRDDLKKYREAIKNAGLNIHECKILAIVELKKEKILMRELNSVVFISDQEFNFLGRLKNELATAVFKGKFDLILLIGDQPKKISKLINKIKHKIQVAVNRTNANQDVYLITQETSPEHLINFAKQTLEKTI